MAMYFRHFPQTFYSLTDQKNSLDIVTNVISRFAFEDSLRENTSAFYKYQIQESDTPEIIASKYYDNPERHWMVLMFNNIVDPQWDWPLEYRVFNEYVDTKYSTPEYADTANTSVSGLSWAKNVNNVQSYIKIVETTLNFEGTSFTKKFEIDEETYNDLPNSVSTYTLPNSTTITESISKERKTYYDYEYELNEKKRDIRLLKKEFAPSVEKEFKRVMKL